MTKNYLSKINLRFSHAKVDWKVELWGPTLLTPTIFHFVHEIIEGMQQEVKANAKWSPSKYRVRNL